MNLSKIGHYKIFFLLGFLVYFLFSLKEIGNFYQAGHAGFINAEVGLSELNTINNGFLKTKFGPTNYKVIYNRAPEKNEYYVRYPYLHPLLVSTLWKITGPSEISARLFTIILVFASFVVIYFLTRELEYSKFFSALVYFSLCSFPMFYHYAGLSNGEISALFPLALSYYFYLKFLKKEEVKHKFFLLISISVTCQLFWYGYLATFLFFLDSLLAFFLQRNKKHLRLTLDLALAVIINIGLYAAHTLWLAGSLKNVVAAFLWRSSIQAPPHQRFTLLQFFIKNLKRWWLFNPLAILFGLANLIFLFNWLKQKIRPTLIQRFHLLLLANPLIFSFLLAHLVHYHDFLLIYFSFFLALSSSGFISQISNKLPQKTKGGFLYFYLFVLIFFAVFGLARHPEEKLIDKDTDNYELYYVCKVVRNMTNIEDRILLTIKRIQEPQVRFYLRRDAYFLNMLNWAKDSIDSRLFSFYLVEDKPRYQSLLKYLIHNYRGYKYDRYFLFSLKKQGRGLRVFKREKKNTNFFFKYFISPYHQPGKYVETQDGNTVRNIYGRLEQAEDLFPTK